MNCARFSVAWLAYGFALLPAFAVEVGDIVVVRESTTLVRDSKSVDIVGPGQLFTVLNINGKHLWVSRGRPGWIADSNVIKLDAAEGYFGRVFATGAGASDYLARGNARIASGKTEVGLGDLKRAVELASDKQPYRESLGFAQLRTADPEAALATFNQALKLTSAASSLMGRGLAYFQMGRNEEACADFRQAIEQQPDHAFPRKYYGAALHEMSQHEAALSQLTRAKELDGFDAFTQKALGRLLFDMQRYDDSLRHFQQACMLDKTDVESIVGRGVVLHAIGHDLKGAKAEFELAIKLSKPEYDTAHLYSNLGVHPALSWVW